MESQLLFFTTNLDPTIPHSIKMTNLENKRLSIDRVWVTQDRDFAGAEYV